MDKKKIVANIVLAVVLLSTVLISWRVGYSMGGKDEIKRMQMMFKVIIEQEEVP